MIVLKDSFAELERGPAKRFYGVNEANRVLARITIFNSFPLALMIQEKKLIVAYFLGKLVTKKLCYEME